MPAIENLAYSFENQTENIDKTSYTLYLDLANCESKLFLGCVYIEMLFKLKVDSVILLYHGELIIDDSAEVNEIDVYKIIEFKKSDYKHSFSLTFRSKLYDNHQGLFTYNNKGIDYIVSHCEPFGVSRIFPITGMLKNRCNIKLYVLTYKFQQCEANGSKIKETKSNEIKCLKDTHPIFESINQLLVPYSTEEIQFFKIHEFETLENFPSHLFCLVVGNYMQYIPSSYNDDKIKLKLLVPEMMKCAHNSKLLQNFYSLTMRSIDYYYKIFRVDFPINKISYVFSQLSFNAMENPGLITVHLANLSFWNDFDLRSISRERMVLHEVAHMYFGYVVSLADWSDMWMKESVAEFWCNKAYQHIVESCEDINIEHFLLLRATSYIKACKTRLNTNQQIHFDSKKDDFYSLLVYYTGERYMKILEKLLGEENMIKLWRLFLNKFYGTAVKTSEFLLFFNNFVNENLSMITQNIENSSGEINIAPNKIVKMLDDYFVAFLRDTNLPILRIIHCNHNVYVHLLNDYAGPIILQLNLYDKQGALIQTFSRIMYDTVTISMKCDPDTYFVVPDQLLYGLYLYQFDDLLFDKQIISGGIHKIPAADRLFILINQLLLHYLYMFDLKKYSEEKFIEILEMENNEIVKQNIRSIISTLRS